MIEFLKQVDTELFIFLNSLNNDFFDSIFLWVTEKYSWIFLYVIMLGVLAWRYLDVLFERDYEGPPDRYWFCIDLGNWPWLLSAALFIALVVAMADQVSVHLFKDVFLRLRPSHEAGLEELIHLPRRRGGLYGFVSSHAATSFALAYFSSRIIGYRWYTQVIFLWAVIFSYSRIYIGMHYPGDSIFGALLGIFIGWMFLRIWIPVGTRWFPSLLPGKIRKWDIPERGCLA
jgi:undecaprenyl-diphosphatase